MSLLHRTEKQKKNNDPIIRLMSTMFIGIFVCIFCLISMTWAWFTASVDTPAQTIQSASRSTSVKVYEISQTESGDKNVTKTQVKPKSPAKLAPDDETQAVDADEGTIITGETAIWELSPEKTYEVVMTGVGTASTGYCKVALSHTLNGSDTPETNFYTTSAFEKDNTVKFTYNTGGFSDAKGVTATQYMEYIENTDAPTLAIDSYWGTPAEDETEQVSLMSASDKSKEIKFLSDGDVLGLAPIPRPEAKAETELELEGFEIQAGAEISAEEDYEISLTLKEGYEMPSEVVVNIDGKDYIISTQGADESEDTPYYNAQTGILTVPSALLSDGIKVSVKAIASPIPEDEPAEDETEENTEETIEEETEENTTEETTTEETTTEETTTDNKTNNGSGSRSDDNIVADNPAKKEEDCEYGNDDPIKTPTGDGGNDDDDENDDDSEDSTTDNPSSGTNEDEKADVKLNLSQLTINLEETQIPTNADLVLTLSAKEDMEFPEKIVITLDKTIRDEEVEDNENEEVQDNDNEEVIEDKTEYIINTDGKDNPEGFEFDAESGELTISSELLIGVREITIADIENDETDKNDEETTLTFEVQNLKFDFAEDEVLADEDVLITFTAGEGYELPETIIITIDDEEYIIYTSEEDSDKNPDGITFDIETGTLTISKDLLEDAKEIIIAAEGVKKEDEEDPDADKKDESEDNENPDKENEPESGDATDKEHENGSDTPNTGDKTEPEGGENAGATTPDPDDNTNSEENGDNDGTTEDGTETPEPGTEPSTPTTPGTEDNTDSEQGGEKSETDENGEGSNDNGTEEPVPGTESGGDDETTTPTEPTTPAEPSEPAETPSTSEPESDGNDGTVSGENGNSDNTSVESNNNSSNESSQSNASSESAASSSPSVAPTSPTTSAPSEAGTSTANNNSSSAPDSSAPAPATNTTSSGTSQATGTTSAESKETSSEE